MKIERKDRKVDESTAVARGGVNVFEDLGFPTTQAADLQIKAGLALKIHRRIKELGLTQVKASAQLGLSQPDVSKLMNGRYTGFSVERLLVLLNALEVDVDIVVRPKHHGRKIIPGVVRVLDAQPA
ncbi:MAG: helix-turn-helix transcriptional regulator [Planctomycetota bacterium]|nr:helix-turn-helix transcriptional regulator [Planctomycetota bacterium]